MPRSVESAPTTPRPDRHLKPLVALQKHLDGVVEARHLSIVTPQSLHAQTLQIHAIGAIEGTNPSGRTTLHARAMEAFFCDWQQPYNTPGGISVYGGLSYVNANRPNDTGSLLIYRKSEAERKPEPKLLVAYRSIAHRHQEQPQHAGLATQQLFDDGEVVDTLDALSEQLALEEKRHGKNRVIPSIDGLRFMDVKHAPIDAFYDILNLVITTREAVDLIS